MADRALTARLFELGQILGAHRFAAPTDTIGDGRKHRMNAHNKVPLIQYNLTFKVEIAAKNMERSSATIDRVVAHFVLDEEKPVVLRDAVRTAKRARLDLRGCAGDC